jgi:long-subunit acyl-CoA synthetase (AMP-forming)
MTVRVDPGARPEADGIRTPQGPAAGASAPATLPGLLLANATRFGRRVAMREKQYGIWQSFTWTECLERVHTLALALARLNFGRGDRIAIVGDNRPELYWALLAAQTLAIIDALYDPTASEVAVRATVRYEDGREGQISRSLRIHVLDGVNP